MEWSCSSVLQYESDIKKRFILYENTKITQVNVYTSTPF